MTAQFNDLASSTRYTAAMLRLIVLLLLIAVPAFAVPHSGVAATRSMPELSDIMLFLCAAAGVWFVRSRLRARFRKTPTAEPIED